MAEDTKAAPPAEGKDALAGGSYEVIQGRLLERAKELGRRTDALNDKRKKAFGGSELALIANERIRTENNCVPRDIKNIGGKLLFGFNVFVGMRTEIEVADVFSVHQFKPSPEGFDLTELPLSEEAFLSDPAFVKDFKDLYRYNRETTLLSLRKTEARLLALFKIGESIRDQRVFRWGIGKSGALAYMDQRGEDDNKLPRSQDFEWRTATREDQVAGTYAHISIFNEVFVETTGGDLTIKVENNTQSGKGIYSEPVEDRNQTLDDADIQYAKVGTLILLRIKPFREDKHRYFVFNTRTKKAVRIDAIGFACLSLPEDQGIIFPGGYYLSTGTYKVFDTDTTNIHYRKTLRSPNGEDVLYVFHRYEDGYYLLLPYNLIRKEISNPIPCQGYSIFDDGKMVLFRMSSDEPTRVHPMQVWQTPFSTPEHAAKAPKDGSYLGKVGNADLVRGVSEAYTLKRLAESEEPNRQTYEDVITGAGRMIDAFYWLGHPDALDLKSIVEEIRKTCELVIDEFEKVRAIKKRAEEALNEAETRQFDILTSILPDNFDSAEGFMGGLTDLRKQRGHLITLRELRYMNLARVEALEADVNTRFTEVSAGCVKFLLSPGALSPLTKRLETFVTTVEKAQKAAELLDVGKDLDRVSEGLSLLGEVIGSLAIDDATARTQILESLSEVYAQQNRARAILVNRKKELSSGEARSEFVAQFKLFGQSITAAIARAETPERCDEELSRLLVQLEELEGKFGEFPEFVAELADKREEASDALAGKRQTLLDERQRRAEGLLGAANRILGGVGRRAKTFKTADDLHAYFASDVMVHKLSDIAKELFAIGESVKAEEVEAKLKTARQDALRGLRDRTDLFEEGENLIKFGAFRFHVSTQALEPSFVARRLETGTALFLNLAGTDFYEPVSDPALDAAKDLWDQTTISESDQVYRAEYLAAVMLRRAELGEDGSSIEKLAHAAVEPGGVLEAVRAFAADRADEGYDRGVHDADAALILERLVSLWRGAGLLRFSPDARALAGLFWASLSPDEKAPLAQRALSLGRLHEKLGQNAAQLALADELRPAVEAYANSLALGLAPRTSVEAARYLVLEIAEHQKGFVTSESATSLESALRQHLRELSAERAFDDDLRRLEGYPSARLALIRAWLDGFLKSPAAPAGLAAYALETASIVFLDRALDRHPSAALTAATITGLLGQHPRVRERSLEVRLDEQLSRTGLFLDERVPRYRAFRKTKHELLEAQKARLRLDELTPRVLSSFVRNRLIDEAYLPLVGQNLAKQIGAAGDAKRTDRMGMLLLISPPGYGKTTLMEYVASRLGLVFVKVNGPALGHDVSSIDPGEAPNATARQEVEKINLALEMGNNVMLYLDDIQHTNPELLQKFISLCDGQRRIEGVWQGKSRTYDLRGKRFCVVMAGNPYTEAGAKFQIPDMLANRADTYNLGEVLEGKDDLFALSYLENSLTSNPALAPLAARDPADVQKLIRMARGENLPATDLAHPYSAAEVAELVAVFERLLMVQKTLLLVNKEYILSASQDDSYRTEPPFKLQGSYRNMNKLAEKVVSAHTPEEIERLVDDHYQSESQTLTKGAEQNLLKLAELRGRMTAEQRARWDSIKSDFVRVKLMGGKADDPITRVVSTIGGIGQQVDGIRKALEQAVGDSQRRADAQAMRPNPTANILRTSLGKIETTLDALRKSLEVAAKASGEKPGGET